MGTDAKYEIIIYWSDRDGCFLAEVPELAGCMAEVPELPGCMAEVPELPGCMADGPTYGEAVSAAQRIIQEWIETARRLGRPIPQPKGRLAYA